MSLSLLVVVVVEMLTDFLLLHCFDRCVSLCRFYVSPSTEKERVRQRGGFLDSVLLAYFQPVSRGQSPCNDFLQRLVVAGNRLSTSTVPLLLLL